MLERIIDLVFKNRLLVVLFFVLCTGLGVWRMLHTAVDAFPDTTPVQVQINAVAPALNPAEPPIISATEMGKLLRTPPAALILNCFCRVYQNLKGSCEPIKNTLTGNSHKIGTNSTMFR